MTGSTDSDRHQASGKGMLREGFTTGSAAAAAAAAALRLILKKTRPPAVNIPLPPFSDGRERARLDIHIAEYAVPDSCPDTDDAEQARAVIVKDGGDDPDATSHARIYADVTFRKDDCATSSSVEIEGGRGVGRVTLPGLPIAVGEAAINPAPREQICAAVREVCSEAQSFGRVRVVIGVENGEELARHTLNARLGILGGISILGTQGIVKPFSHAAWKASIEQALKVALASGTGSAVFSTGRRSEKLLIREFPELPESAFVQAADFAAFSLRSAGKMGFSKIAWGCFFGKLAKLAQGLEYTHAREAPLDMQRLAQTASDAGVKNADRIALCNTANQALDILLDAENGDRAVQRVAEKAKKQAAAFAGMPVHILLFHTDGRLLTAV